jgi:transposase
MMPSGALFDKSELIPPTAASDPEPLPVGKPRLRIAQRHQMVFQPGSLDDSISEDHVVRLIWDYVCGLDLSPMLRHIKAVEGVEGRAMTDPRILMTLWLYATVEGVGSARELARLCECHTAYRWIAGGVSLNHHTLSDFRVAHEEFLDELLTNSVATLMHQGLVELQEVAQDGVRVRASAGTSSFHRRPTLERCLQDAREQVARLKAEGEHDPAAWSARQKAARVRAAEDRQARITQALKELEEIEAKRKASEKPNARASTTDPEARMMKMAGGGFRPAYNVQFATETTSRVVVGVDVIKVGSDKGQIGSMSDQIQKRFGGAPQKYLADGDFQCGDDFQRLKEQGTTVYVPVPKPRDPDRSPETPVWGDSEAVIEWRRRMGTDEAKAIYKRRASVAEWLNAQRRNHGLQQFRVRGRPKVRCIALWHAIAHNFLQTFRLRSQIAT